MERLEFYTRVISDVDVEQAKSLGIQRSELNPDVKYSEEIEVLANKQVANRCGGLPVPRRGAQISLNDTHFKHRLDLQGMVLQSTSFLGSSFDRHVTLGGCLLLEYILFDVCTFSEQLNVHDVICRKRFSASDVNVSGRLRCANLEIQGDLDLDSGNFAQDVAFRNVECRSFYGDSSAFLRKLHFDRFKVGGDANWGGSTFEGDFQLINSEVGANTSFAGCSFSDNTLFQGLRCP